MAICWLVAREGMLHTAPGLVGLEKGSVSPMVQRVGEMMRGRWPKHLEPTVVGMLLAFLERQDCNGWRFAQFGLPEIAGRS